MFFRFVRKEFQTSMSVLGYTGNINKLWATRTISGSRQSRFSSMNQLAHSLCHSFELSALRESRGDNDICSEDEEVTIARKS